MFSIISSQDDQKPKSSSDPDERSKFETDLAE